MYHYITNSVLIRVRRGAFTIVTKRFYETSIAYIYTLFKAKYPQLKIGLTQFAGLKPFFVKRLTMKDRSTCLCTYHVNFTLYINALAGVKGLFNFVASAWDKDDSLSDDEICDAVAENTNTDVASGDPGLQPVEGAFSDCDSESGTVSDPRPPPPIP